MSASNLDAFDLKSINLEGMIHEDVLNSISDISKISLPFTERAGTATHSNQNFTWPMDKLRAPVTTGQRVDGADVTGDDTKNGRRVGNHSEIRSKRIPVSTRAQRVNTIGFANALARQITERMQELKRDVEATCLSNNASVEGTDTVAGVTAGLNAWITSLDVDGNAATDPNVFRGAVTGADGGWDDTDTDGLVAAATLGTVRAITETLLRDVVEGIFSKGGEPSSVMVPPKLKRRISEYLFTSSARVATMINDMPAGSAPERKAQGSVDLFITDFGSLELIPNRLQLPLGTDNHSAYVLDWSFVSLSFLQGYQVEPLAKTGLADNRLLSVDWGLRVGNWDAIGAVADVNPALAMTA